MRCGLIAKKIGMTRVFSKEGNDIPITVLKLEDVQVTAIMTEEKNGYLALQVGAGKAKTKNISKPMRGHFAKAKVEPKRILREFIVSQDMLLNVGDTFSSNHYAIGQKVDVSGTSIGKGFSGAMKRHNFAGLEATHGVSISHRSHGSTGNSQDPGRVWKGKKMAGQYGNVNKTIQSLTIVDLNSDEDLIFVKGSVPGPKNSFVVVNDALKAKLPEEVPKPAGLKTNNISNSKQNDENTVDIPEQNNINESTSSSTKKNETDLNKDQIEVKKDDQNKKNSIDKNINDEKHIIEKDSLDQNSSKPQNDKDN